MSCTAIELTPLSLTSYCISEHLKSKKLDPHTSKTEKNAYARLICFLEATALRIIDFIGNLLLAVLKFPIAILLACNIRALNCEDFSFNSIVKHIQEFALAFIQAPFASIGGLIDPRFITEVCSPMEIDVEAKEDIGLSPYFDKGYILHLPNRTDRQELLDRHLPAIGIDRKTEIFTATNAKENLEMIHALIEVGLIDHSITSDEKETFLKQLVDRMAGGSEASRRGRLACFLGHMRMIQKAMEECPNQNVIIFEDDVMFTDRSKKTIAKSLPKLPKACEMLYLGNSFKPLSKPYFAAGEHFSKAQGALATHAYLLQGREHPNIFHDLLFAMKQHLKSESIVPVDHFYTYVQSASATKEDGASFNIMVMKDRIASQFSTYSDVIGAHRAINPGTLR